ncbi:MAG: GNAT family protein [bacterium]|nr:GNAT family protein [bacterium]MDE0239827.1 GNAT family protein [bacterium]MDE0417861.1 GNAT family protein [bacterium]
MFAFLRKPASRHQLACLESVRLALRPPAIDDWPQWARLRNESRDFLQPWEPTWPRNALTRGSFTRRIKLQARDREAGTALSWFLIRRDDEALMGGVTVSDIRRGVASSGTLGYWIGRSYSRQGYMSEAVEAVIDHVFDEFGLHRLEAACLPANEASRRLLVSRGFSLEGIARSYLKIDGDWRDHLLFSLIESEWRPSRRSHGPEP